MIQKPFPSGIDVFVSKTLPYDETRLASDVETRKEVQILTGKQVHVIKIENTIHVSSWYFWNIIVPDSERMEKEKE